MNKKCLLCKINDVYLIKSHITPAVITSNTFGKRHSEEIYTIDPNESKIEQYFGPQNKQTESTEIKPEPHTHRGIFCKDCEDNLAKYEFEVQNKLVDIVNSIGKGVEIWKTKKNTKFTAINIHPNILLTFFQSIVWRQCVNQIINNKDSPLDSNELEILRQILLNNIYTLPSKIVENDLSGNPKITLLTSYNINELNESNFVNPNIYKTNPQLFFIGAIMLLYWNKDELDEDFEIKTHISPEILENDLNLDNGKLIVINEAKWEKIIKLFVKTTARIYNKSKNPR